MYSSIFQIIIYENNYSAVFSAAAASVLTNPLDVAKLRLQVKSTYLCVYF
jgi:hypothetical protein